MSSSSTISSWRPPVTLAALAVSLFISVAATTTVSVALPSIGEQFRLTPAQGAWIVSAFVVPYAAILMVGGSVGDRVGRKGLYLVGAALFGIGSVTAGFAPNFVILILGRVIQGLGPALLVTGSLTIIRAIFTEPAKRAVAIGVWSTSSGLAIALGPLLGGLVTDTWGWRWVLLANGPLALILIGLAAVAMPKLPVAAPGAPFDVIGGIEITIAIAAFAFGINVGPEVGWTSITLIVVAVVFVATAGGFIVHELRTPAPLTDLRLFRSLTFTAANVAGMIVFLAFIGSIIYFSSYFQRVQGLTPVQTGLALLALGIAFAVGSNLSGRIANRFGPLPPMLTGLGLAAVGMALLVALEVDTPLGAIWWKLVIAGLGVGLSLTPMTNVTMSAVGVANAGMASALHMTMRQVGQALGISVLGAIVYANAPSAGHLSAADKQQLVFGLHRAFGLSSGLLLGALVLTVVLFAIARSRRSPAPASTPTGRTRIEGEGA